MGTAGYTVQIGVPQALTHVETAVLAALLARVLGQGGERRRSALCGLCRTEEVTMRALFLGADPTYRGAGA
jgi:hypothetical protein